MFNPDPEAEKLAKLFKSYSYKVPSISNDYAKDMETMMKDDWENGKLSDRTYKYLIAMMD